MVSTNRPAPGPDPIAPSLHFESGEFRLKKTAWLMRDFEAFRVHHGLSDGHATEMLRVLKQGRANTIEEAHTLAGLALGYSTNHPSHRGESR